MTAGRLLAGLLVLAVGPSGRLTAQVSFHVALGARYSSALVHDSIGTPVDLRPTIAPAFLVAARQVLNPRWSADITLDVAPSGLRRHETGGSFDAGSVTTAAFTVGLRRALPWGLSGRAGFGALRYLGASDGVFREGSGGLFPLGTLAVAIAPPSLSRRRVELEARYDVHRFITPALRSDGFTGARPVHRLALLVRLGWGGASTP